MQNELLRERGNCGCTGQERLCVHASDHLLAQAHTSRRLRPLMRKRISAMAPCAWFGFAVCARPVPVAPRSTPADSWAARAVNISIVAPALEHPTRAHARGKLCTANQDVTSATAGAEEDR